MTLLDKIDRAILKSIKVTHTVEHEPRVNADSLEIGSSSKGGVIKVYGDFNDPEAFQIKLDKAISIRNHAIDLMNKSMNQNE